MDIRPYSLLGNAFLHRLEDKVRAIASEWQREWGAHAISIDVACIRYWEQSQKETAWQHHYQNGNRSAWISYPSELVKLVQRQIFPSDSRYAHPSGDHSPIAVEGAQKAIMALADAIAAEFDVQRLSESLDDAGPGPELGLIASGAVLIIVKVGGQPIKYLLNHAAAQVKLPVAYGTRQSPLGEVKLMKALAATSVGLEVSAGQVNVSAASLVGLVPGDVIRLPISVDKPLSVLGPDKRILFGAYLGKQSQSLAIEVVPLSK